MKFFTGVGGGGNDKIGNKLKICVEVNKSNTVFLKYLMRDYAKNVFVKNDMKTHV